MASSDSPVLLLSSLMKTALQPVLRQAVPGSIGTLRSSSSSTTGGGAGFGVDGKDDARAAVVKTSFPSASEETTKSEAIAGPLFGLGGFCAAAVCLPN